MALTKVLTGGLAADAVDNTILKLDDDYALTGTVTGAGSFQKVSSSTSTTTGISSLVIALPTTTDFSNLKLILRGIKCESVVSNHWGMRFRNVGGSIITSTSYSFIQNYSYSNDSDNGTVPWNDLNATSIFFGGYVGDGSDDSEMASWEIDIQQSAATDRYTRGFVRKGLEKRHNDTYHYGAVGSFYVSSNNALDQIEIFAHTTPNFTTYGYALYKMML